MTDKEFNENELLFDELYEKTKDCGRVQFINLLMEKERENQELKKQLSNDHQIKMKRLQQENRKLKQQISNSHQMKNQQKEFMEWLESEKDRLAKECSHTYEDSLGRMLYVNEDIYNEVNKILSKYKGIIGVNGD